jgi:hypothetical protein
MASYPPRSLRHEYDLYVEHEIECYKDSVPRSALLSIGDEAVAALREQEQLALDEMVLWDEVDRIIKLRLRIPSYQNWRRRRLRMLAKYRRPEHWGIQPTDALVRAITPNAETHVLVAGAKGHGAALYLAANGCEVTAVEPEEAVIDRVMSAAAAVGLTQRVHGRVCDLGRWSPQLPLSAVVCTPAAFSGLGSDERARVIRVLQSATEHGGVHLVETIVAGQAVMTLEELATRYAGWEISVERGVEAAGTFLARKGASWQSDTA